MATLADVVLTGTAASMPTASIPGRIFYTTDTLQIFRDNGTSWDNVTPTGSGLTNPMATEGDIIVGGTSGIPERLGIGSAGEVLTVVSGLPA